MSPDFNDGPTGNVWPRDSDVIALKTNLTDREPMEAVASIEWTGHRLLYLEAVLKEAARQNRPHLVFVDTKALEAPEWPRIEATLDGHSLRPVDFGRVDLGEVLPMGLERVIVLEADALMYQFTKLLRARPGLHASLQLMREPDRGILGHASRALASRSAKTALIITLRKMFGSRCSVHVLRSPLFPPSPTTRFLKRRGWCTTLTDPVLSPPVAVAPLSTPSDQDPPFALITGQLNARKSLDALLATWHHEALQPYKLMLKGRVSDGTDVAGLVVEARARGANVELDSRYFSDAELADLMASASAVLCLHQSDVPSGVAALAVQTGCPVVAFAHTQLGQALAAHGLGTAIDAVDGRQLATALDACVQLSRSNTRSIAAKLHEDATTEAFSRQLLDLNPPHEPRSGGAIAANAPKTPLFFTAKAQYENVGDLVINRLALRELQKHGVVHVNRSTAPAEYLGALGANEETSMRWFARSVWFSRLIASAARGQNPVLVFRPGGDRIQGYVSNFDRMKAGLFAQLTRAGIRQAKYGASYHGERSLDGGRIKHLDSLLVRDRDSLHECRASSDRHIDLIPDMACLLPFDPQLARASFDNERHLLSVCLRSVEAGLAAWNDVEHITTLAADLDLDLTVVSQVQLDEATSWSAARRLAAPMIAWRGDMTTLLPVLDTYDHSRFTISSRLHAALLAALCGSIPIVIETPKGKSRKVAACFEYLELGGLVVGSIVEAAELTRTLATDGVPADIEANLISLRDGTVGQRIIDTIAADLASVTA